MRRMIFSFATCAIAFSLPLAQASAQDSWALTDDERNVALKAEQALFDLTRAQPEILTNAAAIPSLAGATKAADRKSVLISVTPVGSMATVESIVPKIDDAGISPRRAIVTRFEYSTGQTVRTWIDLQSGDVLRTRADVNYPTPLAAEELNEAIKLWREASPDIDAAFSDEPDDIRMLHMVPLAPQASSPRYGHRVVVMWLTAPITTHKFVVNLSTEEVSKQ